MKKTIFYNNQFLTGDLELKLFFTLDSGEVINLVQDSFLFEENVDVKTKLEHNYYKFPEDMDKNKINDCILQFKKDLEKENNIVNHPKKDLLWEVMWEEYAQDGFDEVQKQYNRHVKLIR